MENRFDIIVIGDSTIDTFIKIHDASVACDLNTKECKICIKYGSKIPVESIAHGVAGNAANVAVACSNLGLKSGIYTNLGADKQGELIKNALVARGVLPDYIVESGDKSSNLSVVLTFQNERTIFVYHQDWHYQLPDNMAAASWIYLTSMAETFVSSNIMDEVCRYVDRNGAKLAYAPGTYQHKAGIKKYPKILDRCELLIVNLEEAHSILGLDGVEKTAIRDILSKILLLGPKIVVVTDGEEGSYASNGKEYLNIGIFPAQVVEKTGAGDAYSGAFISALSLGKEIGEAMVWGALNSSHAISEIGAQNGLMTKDEIIRYRSSVPEFVASNL
jgi:ribokinase